MLFRFFRAGELTVATPLSFNPAIHLAWGDVSVSQDGRVVQVFLKRSKTDQYAGLYWKDGRPSLPRRSRSLLSSHCSSAPGAFFCTAEGIPLTKSCFVDSPLANIPNEGSGTHTKGCMGMGGGAGLLSGIR